MQNQEEKTEQSAEIGIKQNPLLEARCIYCKQGTTEKNPMLFRIWTAGEYWQHWSFENIGCDENTENRNPAGDVVVRNGGQPL